MQSAQNVGKVFHARQFFPLGGQRAVDLFGGHEPKPQHGFQNGEIEGGEEGFHRKGGFVDLFDGFEEV